MFRLVPGALIEPDSALRIVAFRLAVSRRRTVLSSRWPAQFPAVFLASWRLCFFASLRLCFFAYLRGIV